MEDDSHSSFSLSNLLCQETETCLLVREDDAVDEDTFINSSSYSVSDDDVEMLIQREIHFCPKKQESLVMSNWVKSARLNAITWIIKTRAVFGFQYQTVYQSVTYFDRFLSRRAIDTDKMWAIQLLSVACLSLAAKMEECKVPSLTEFHTEDFNFNSGVIKRMEFLVLNTLEWRMGSITPFNFIHYFVTKFSTEPPPTKIVSKTVEIILAIMKEIDLVHHRPSIIAAAATLAALDERLTRKALECKMNAIFSYGLLEIEDLYSCYTIMQQQETEKDQIANKSIVSPELSPIHLRQINGHEISSVTSTVSTKRRRLTYNDFDQNHGMPD